MEFADRNFQLWEFKVSHGSLLIRSPKETGTPTNIDLICTGVEYFEMPRHLLGLTTQEASTEEMTRLSNILRRKLDSSSIRIIVSQGHRFPIVAASFRLSENDSDIFESPFK